MSQHFVPLDSSEKSPTIRLLGHRFPLRCFALAVVVSALIIGPLSMLSAGPKPTLIVDTDGHTDDLFALALLFGSATDYDVKLITTVRGMAHSHQAAAVLQQLLDLVGVSGIEIVAGAAYPLPGGHVLEELEWGRELMKQAPQQLASLGLTPPEHLAKSPEDNAVDALLSTIKQNCGHTSLLCIGPLTNIARALQRDRAAMKKCLSSVVVMGGAVHVPGNAGPGNKAEFNFYCDPQAVRQVLQAELPLTLVDLDVASESTWPTSTHHTFSALPVMSPVGRMLKDLLRVSPQSLAYDPVAMSFLIQPQLFKTDCINVHVDDTGVTTECDFSNAHGRVNLVTSVDVQGYQKLLRDAFMSKP